MARQARRRDTQAPGRYAEAAEDGLSPEVESPAHAQPPVHAHGHHSHARTGTGASSHGHAARTPPKSGAAAKARVRRPLPRVCARLALGRAKRLWGTPRTPRSFHFFLLY